LWLVLSGSFADNEVDYGRIASVAKNYSLSEVEFAFFERVAPVCIYNMLMPAPSVYWFFDGDQLFSEIESLIKKQASRGPASKLVALAQGWFIRLACREIWAEIKTELKSQQENSSRVKVLVNRFHCC
jgi:hypothetical protein